jgi:hypothetical protein
LDPATAVRIRPGVFGGVPESVSGEFVVFFNVFAGKPDISFPLISTGIPGVGLDPRLYPAEGIFWRNGHKN